MPSALPSRTIIAANQLRLRINRLASGNVMPLRARRLNRLFSKSARRNEVLVLTGYIVVGLSVLGVGLWLIPEYWP